MAGLVRSLRDLPLWLLLAADVCVACLRDAPEGAGMATRVGGGGTSRGD